MGVYATTTEFGDFLIDTTLDTATTSLIGKCIDHAETEVNKKLASRFDVSSFASSVPPHVKTLTQQIAMGWFYFHDSRGSKESFKRAEILWKDARDNLNDLAKYKLALVDSDGSLIPNRAGADMALCNTDDYAPTFAEDSDLKWKVDPNKLRAISDERN